MKVLMGASNGVRGGPHSGNVAAVRILADRGEIAMGLRAVQARSCDGLPVMQHVWRQAKKVF